MNHLFLDTGYLIALEAADDQYHQAALTHWHGLTKALPQLVTTSYVLNEVTTFFNSRHHHAKAVEVGNRLLESSIVRLIHVDEALFHVGWRYFKKHDDKSYSITDCISFVVMERLGIHTALAFDKHFVQAGFEKLP